MIKRYISYIGKIPLCNKDRNKAPKVFGYSFLLCCRCSGLVIGGIVGSLLYNSRILVYKNNILFITILSMPFILDIFFQFILQEESTNTRRFITGLLFGIALANLRPI